MKRPLYAVVDLETTGGLPKRDKIIEVAILVTDGREILDDFQSLIFPERSIPANITRITGIDNSMVEDAPKFYEVAKKIIELTEGAIFVAHNVRFDYQFLREEFRQLGFVFTRRYLCTVRMSRLTFPDLKSYSLGNLISHFGIEVTHRHRAYDDAYATAILLRMIIEKHDNPSDLRALLKEGFRLTKLPTGLDISDIEDLPDACGVYYFLNDQKDVVYVGKSKNIRERVKQHFSAQTSKTDKLFQKVSSIQCEITGSELASLLYESEEIKRIQPEVNKIQKTKDYGFALLKEVDKSGYYFYKILKADKVTKPLSYYSSRKSAKNHIKQIGEAFALCHKVNKVDKSKTSCFKYELDKCNGACIGEEPPYIYNERFEESLIFTNRVFEDNLVIIDEGRQSKEHTVFLVEDGHYRGFGYIIEDDIGYGIEEMKEAIDYKSINPEADMILRNYIWSNNKLKVYPF